MHYPEIYQKSFERQNNILGEMLPVENGSTDLVAERLRKKCTRKLIGATGNENDQAQVV